jgi:hypothetical protein
MLAERVALPGMQYGISGVMMFVVESPTRQAARVNSGAMASGINIGTRIDTRIGASRAHPDAGRPAPTRSGGSSQGVIAILITPSRWLANSA